ncbi:winged helix DNA-binding domain-containing protein [Rhizopus microsporus ATCC 52813]|uniref:Winged helix DNA-binding domain-containing protein n=1 Tax=Rhizopus microsporus ATCC 52813 TaxID=1340429 RepID=A0A2G4T0F1_RHIZD|nr:winged helix DNA-binding domain-containing protein [Rhizopus microsporus ATCC 52813]PHZ14484.1 winged helix DNA-binding domain-containing protein [Rhizopus microsporus ATCC 52813]
MLEDTSIQHLISWSKKGDQFNVPNPTTFSRTVLPQYFKHSNWQSFVRQLNMYGFHKVNDMIHANSSHQTWEFKHPHFKRGAIEDLQYIKRKNNNQNNITKARMIPDLQKDDCSVYSHLIHVEDRLTHAVRTYQMLQDEVIMLKTLLSKQHGTMIEFTQLFSDVVQDRSAFYSLSFALFFLYLFFFCLS